MNAKSPPTILRLALALSLALALAPPVLAQAPPGIEPDAGPKKLNLFSNLLGGPGGGSGEHVQLSASFTVNKATRRGILTVSAIIDPEWHIYSLTQPSGGPGKSELKVAKSPNFAVMGLFQPDTPPLVKPPEVFKVNSEEHAGAVNWLVPIEIFEG